MLSPDRYFDPDPTQKAVALDLYARAAALPIVSPHGHVSPALFSDANARFGSPTELLLQPDHYVLRMLNSQGIPYEQLLDKDDPRKSWRLFASNFYLFRGTPSGAWLTHELEWLFGVEEKLSADSADRIYDQIAGHLNSPDFTPRALFERFNIEVMATTDAAGDTLEHHQAIRSSGWKGRIIPTFRPDNVVNLTAPGWKANIARLSAVSGIDVDDYASFIRALEQRREFFKAMGATATDHAAISPATDPLSPDEADTLFQRALHGAVSEAEVMRFGAHMLSEMARMSCEDGLVMQIHPGSIRNHNSKIFAQYGSDMGFDIPTTVEYTLNLRPLIERYGANPNLTVVLFTLDETNYSRELAPLAGAYPALRIGPPWWFYDSWNGLRRYFDQVMETAGLYNTAGFNDDTRAFPSIPSRHDVWRRAAANWLAGLTVRGFIDHAEAEEMMADMAVGLARRVYKLDS